MEEFDAEEVADDRSGAHPDGWVGQQPGPGVEEGPDSQRGAQPVTSNEKGA